MTDRCSRSIFTGRAGRVLAWHLLLLPVLAGGCHREFKVGPWVLIRSAPPPKVSRLEIFRHPVDVSAEAGQKLNLDMVSGRAALTDVDQQVHPVELDPDLVARIRSDLASRSWQSVSGSDRDDGALAYRLIVHGVEAGSTQTVKWRARRDHALPPPLGTIMTTFDQAVRQVHPLSRTVNLIE